MRPTHIRHRTSSRAPLLTIAVIAAALVVGLAPGRARAWGGAGHHIIARIAMDRLASTSPTTAATVRRILGGTSVESAAVWPDTLRGDPAYANTLPWHFVDIPIDAAHYQATRDCARESGPACTVGQEPTCGECVIAEIERNQRDLRDRKTSRTKRREALMFLIHMVGDLHQPLHCADDHGDRGGNKKPVCFFGQCWTTHGDGAGKNNNLHAAWDTSMIARQERARHGGEREYAAALEQAIGQLSPAAISKREGGTLIDWAEQSHRHAVNHAYKLPPRVKKRNPFDRISYRYYPLGESYFQDNITIIDDQLMTAGIRLARVLRDTLE
jgi:hypothetical protein